METKQSKEELLKQLLAYSDPKELIRTIQSTFYSYLLQQDKTGLDGSFKSVVENHYMLVEFLEGLEKVKN